MPLGKRRSSLLALPRERDSAGGTRRAHPDDHALNPVHFAPLIAALRRFLHHRLMVMLDFGIEYQEGRSNCLWRRGPAMNRDTGVRRLD